MTVLKGVILIIAVVMIVVYLITLVKGIVDYGKQMNRMCQDDKVIKDMFRDIEEKLENRKDKWMHIAFANESSKVAKEIAHTKLSEVNEVIEEVKLLKQEYMEKGRCFK